MATWFSVRVPPQIKNDRLFPALGTHIQNILRQNRIPSILIGTYIVRL